MKKIIIVIIVTLMVLVGCSTKPQEKEPYIEFNADEFYLEYGSEFEPLSMVYIKDYYGVISYVGDIDTELPGEYILNYNVTDEDGKNIQEYEIVFNVVSSISEEMQFSCPVNIGADESDDKYANYFFFPNGTGYFEGQTDSGETYGFDFNFEQLNKYLFKMDTGYDEYFLIVDNLLFRNLTEEADFDWLITEGVKEDYKYSCKLVE